MEDLISLAAAVLLHEAGHLLAACLLGIPLRRGSGGLFGVRLTFDFSRAGYLREAAVHLAGPSAGIVTAFAAYGAAGGAAIRFAGMNLALAAVNLLPLEGFDGGGALLCLLRLCFRPEDAGRADAAARAVSGTTRVLLWLAAVRSALTAVPNVGLLLFAAGETVRFLPRGRRR